MLSKWLPKARTFLFLKHWRWTCQGKLGFVGSAGCSQVGAGKHRGLWRRSTICHNRWGVCRRHQRIHTGKENPFLGNGRDHTLFKTVLCWIFITPFLLITYQKCLSAQTLSPLSKGLFHKAIFQSGVATLGAYTSDQPLNQAHVRLNVFVLTPKVDISMICSFGFALCMSHWQETMQRKKSQGKRGESCSFKI